MPPNEEQLKQSVEQAFEKVLNRHGYGFHFAVLKKLHELAEKGKSSFLFETVEFPVEVRGSGTRIDFILSKRYSRETPPFFLLAECKRANPARANWCFAKAPYTVRDPLPHSEPTYIEYISRVGGGFSAFAKPRGYVKNAYHIGLEVRSNVKGDEKGESGHAIEDAASQILRGLNGYVNTISQNTQILRNHNTANLMPIIFTTAKLWASEVDLTKTALSTGNSDFKNADFNLVPWLFYQYHLSPGIKHLNSPKDKPSEIKNLITTEFIRTVPIVGVEGIEDFMRWVSFGLDLDDY